MKFNKIKTDKKLMGFASFSFVFPTMQMPTIDPKNQVHKLKLQMLADTSFAAIAAIPIKMAGSM